MVYNNELYHHGIKGQKWGVRRYQNKDGTMTDAGKKKRKIGIDKHGRLSIVDSDYKADKKAKINFYTSLGMTIVLGGVAYGLKTGKISLTPQHSTGKKYVDSWDDDDWGPEIVRKPTKVDEIAAEIAADYLAKTYYRELL